MDETHERSKHSTESLSRVEEGGPAHAEQSARAQEDDVNNTQLYVAYVKSELSHPTFLQSVLAEWWGTTLLVFFLILSILPGQNDGQEIFRVACVSGTMVAVLVYGLYSVSGSNLNPAITLGLALSGGMTVPRAVSYLIAQLLGAITGAAMARGVSPGAFIAVNGGVNALGIILVTDVIYTVTAGQALWAEIMATFVLVLVFLYCTDPERVALQSSSSMSAALLPLATGLVVFVDHLVLFPFDGCSINPARSFGPAALSGLWKDHWVFWFGPLLGAALAALSYRLVFLPTDDFNALVGRDGTVWAMPGKLIKDLSAASRPMSNRQRQ